MAAAGLPGVLAIRQRPGGAVPATDGGTADDGPGAPPGRGTGGGMGGTGTPKGRVIREDSRGPISGQIVLVITAARLSLTGGAGPCNITV